MPAHKDLSALAPRPAGGCDSDGTDVLRRHDDRHPRFFEMYVMQVQAQGAGTEKTRLIHTNGTRSVQ
jgi:hypothetical protein